MRSHIRNRGHTSGLPNIKMGAAIDGKTQKEKDFRGDDQNKDGWSGWRCPEEKQTKQKKKSKNQ